MLCIVISNRQQVDSYAASLVIISTGPQLWIKSESPQKCTTKLVEKLSCVLTNKRFQADI